MADVNAKVDYEYRVSGAEQAGGAMEGMIGKAALLAAAFAAARAAVDFFSESISSAVDANEDMNKFMVVMGDNAGLVNSQLNILADTTNRNVYELRALAAGVQDMLVPMGVARDEAAQMSTDFVALATDMSSFNNVPVGETLAAIQSALAGQSRPLRRFGVDTRVAALESQALAMGIDASWQEMTQAQQAQVLYAKVVADTADAQGDAARTADQAANVLVGFRSSIEEGKVAIGEEFLPVIEELVPLLKDELADALPILQDIARQIATDARKYGPVVIKVLGAVIDVVGFAVEHFEDLQKSMRFLGGPGVWAISEAVEALGDATSDANFQTEWFAESVGSLTGALMSFERTLPPAITYTADLGDQVLTLTDYTKDLTREQIAAAMATIELNRVELMRSADLKGGITPAIAARIEQMNAYVLQLKGLAGTIRETESAAGAGAGFGGGGGAGMGTDPAEMGKYDFAARAQQQAQAEIERIQAVSGKWTEITDMQQAREQAIYAQRMQAIQGIADRSINIIAGGFRNGFDGVMDDFKNMLADMAAEYLKSQLVRLLVSGAVKGATGGAGFFL